MSNQVKNETGARYPRNIYFNAEAWSVLEKPLFENGKQLGRSAKVNRAILQNLTKVKSQDTYFTTGIKYNLKALAQEIKLLSNIQEPSVVDRFDKMLIILETIISSLET